jgi:hypothetical protein
MTRPASRLRAPDSAEAAITVLRSDAEDGERRSPATYGGDADGVPATVAAVACASSPRNRRPCHAGRRPPRGPLPRPGSRPPHPQQRLGGVGPAPPRIRSSAHPPRAARPVGITSTAAYVDARRRGGRRRRDHERLSADAAALPQLASPAPARRPGDGHGRGGGRSLSWTTRRAARRPSTTACRSASGDRPTRHRRVAVGDAAWDARGRSRPVRGRRPAVRAYDVVALKMTWTGRARSFWAGASRAPPASGRPARSPRARHVRDDHGGRRHPDLLIPGSRSGTAGPAKPSDDDRLTFTDDTVSRGSILLRRRRAGHELQPFAGLCRDRERGAAPVPSRSASGPGRGHARTRLLGMGKTPTKAAEDMRSPQSRGRAQQSSRGS